MSVSLRESIKVGSYVLWHRLKGTERFPLVLMLEPLFRCNLECAGCGKIQYPPEILRKRLSPEECFASAENVVRLWCRLPAVSHSSIRKSIAIAGGLVERRKFVYLCTNAILLERKLQQFKPSPYLTFSIHMDGLEKRHDELVCRKGVFKTAIQAIKAAKQAGFRVTTNTTIFQGEDPSELHEMFDLLMEVGVDGMMVSPGYAYSKAPDQDHFLRRQQTIQLFREILKNGRGRQRWQFNHSPYYLDFLRGERSYQCTPWGNPTRNIFGWQRPCYLMSDGYAKTFKELLETTDWERYGTGRDPRCADCMVHCGYEPTSVLDATQNPLHMLKAAKATFFA